MCHVEVKQLQGDSLARCLSLFRKAQRSRPTRAAGFTSGRPATENLGAEYHSAGRLRVVQPPGFYSVVQRHS